MTLLDRNATVDGRRLAYRHITGESGETLVFLHGTPSHAFIWRDVLGEVEAQGHEVIAFDLLGYGQSERPVDADTSISAQAGLLGGLLDQLGIERCTLVGHDLGGAIAQIFATRAPERVDRMMLVDAVGYDSWPSATWREIIREHLDRYAGMSGPEFETMLTRQLRMTVADPERMSGQVLEAYLAPHRGVLGRMSFFEHQVRQYDSTPTQRVAPLLPSLAMPVRILWGTADRWQPVEIGHRLHADIPHSELVTIEQAGHFLMEDQPRRVSAELHRLLASPADQS